ncbi:Fe2+-dicitrate sensor, membrane component [Labrys okinawensis]|uniref:Fe2+-dicitrate sensor, membrane component n=1 Tax=Labrys okinawensis TaxID=346911 RepID=A0A2S9Q8K9_9HYPH|nr:FecR family protein [Labrys okinawensis]PRH85693.1 Fe2+-dicitrate sensor, membrane component [Labrys okinawensis]
MASPQSSRADVEQEARDWFVRRLGGLSRAEQAAFEHWLGSDPAHADALRRTEEVWNAAEQPARRLATRENEALAPYLYAVDRGRRQHRTFRRLSTAALALTIGLGGVLWLQNPHLLQKLMADHSTGRGERRTVTLSDGSKVLLDADSAFDETFDKNERQVKLLRGTASFDVAPGKAPFVVRVPDGAIRDIGTQFDVNLGEDGTVVTLESGKVAVKAEHIGEALLDEPGQRLRFDRQGLGEIEQVDLKDALAWRQGRYVFYRARLSDVIEEIARYRRGRIIVTDAGLGDQLVTGSFSLADTDAALQSLQASVGFRMTALPGGLVVFIRP